MHQPFDAADRIGIGKGCLAQIHLIAVFQGGQQFNAFDGTELELLRIASDATVRNLRENVVE